MTECPRWRLITPHYLPVATLPDGTAVEWEHSETNRETGRAARKRYVVPAYLDAETIVTQEVEGARVERGDVVFTGPPSPDMDPINDEAQEITNAHRERWEHPIESLPVNGGMNDKEMAFMNNMMRAFGQQAQQSESALVPKAQYDALAERLAKLEAILAGDKAAAPVVARRA